MIWRNGTIVIVDGVDVVMLVLLDVDVGNDEKIGNIQSCYHVQQGVVSNAPLPFFPSLFKQKHSDTKYSR
jgi:hypothetical protein